MQQKLGPSWEISVAIWNKKINEIEIFKKYLEFKRFIMKPNDNPALPRSILREIPLEFKKSVLSFMKLKILGKHHKAPIPGLHNWLILLTSFWKSERIFIEKLTRN